MLGRQFPQAKPMLLEAATDITAFADFPSARWEKFRSTNPAALDRLTAVLPAELHDEGRVSTAVTSQTAPWPNSSTPNPPGTSVDFLRRSRIRSATDHTTGRDSGPGRQDRRVEAVTATGLSMCGFGESASVAGRHPALMARRPCWTAS
ncbi:hypothetical protein O1M07_01590 [Streptomyces albulus]|nr:hypothetical protein [Streptomyces noursei]